MLFAIIYFTGCSNQNEKATPKVDEYIEVISVTEMEKDLYEVRYKLLKDLDRGSGLVNQNLFFSSEKENIPLVSTKKGTEVISIKGKEIILNYLGSNKYIEEKKLN